MAALRLFTILRIFAKYRLQTLLVKERLPFIFRISLSALPWFLFPDCSKGLTRAERLRLSLEELGPVFVKFGQLLSTRPDLIAQDIAAELCKLQDDVPPFDNVEFIAIVETALESSVEAAFKNFEREPLASASVAQVHAATLLNGKDVVVKVIRPGIEKIIEQDVSLMLFMARAVECLFKDGKRLHLIEIVQDYRLTILDELDLQREAANAAQLRRNFLTPEGVNSSLLYIPEVYWDYCRNNVMVMERIDGIPVSNIATLKEQNTNIKLLAERGVELFFTQVFKHNFFHADMHPGNIFVSRKHPSLPQYMAVDFAIVGSLSRDDQHYLARNLLAIFNRDYRQVAELHVECGWVPKHIRVGEFESAIRTVCEPIFEKPLGEISYGHILVNLFRTARRFEMEVQPSLVLLQKTLLNIEGLGRQLYPQLDLWTTAKPFLESWLKDRIHPKTLLDDFRRYGPEWLEKFPQVPDLLFDAMHQIQNLENLAHSLQRKNLYVSAQASHQNFSSWIGWLCVLSAGYISYPSILSMAVPIPFSSIALSFSGLYFLFKRK